MFLEMIKSNGGFTYDSTTGRFVEHGFAVGCNQHTYRIPLKWLNEINIVRYIKQFPGIIGAWYDKDTGDVTIEVPYVFTTFDLAHDTAIIHKQKSIYDLDRKILITLN